MSLGHARPASADDTRVRRALVLMAQRLSDPMPIHELAARLQLSTRHVERLFQGVVGAKPRAVYRRMRLRRAHWMLANTCHSITAIAIDTGFSDGAHFSRQFKEMTGVSPSAARQSLGDGEACRPDPAFAQFDGFELERQDSGAAAPDGRRADSFPWGETATRTLSPNAGERPGCIIDKQNRRSVRTHAGREFDDVSDDAADFGCAHILKGNSNAQPGLVTQ